MASFYVLPPRACLDEAVGTLLGRLLPGLPIPTDTWDAIVDRLAACGNWPDDVYFVPRDDLPEGEPIADALADVFGAVQGDDIVEVSLGAKPARRWQLADIPGQGQAR